MNNWNAIKEHYKTYEQAIMSESKSEWAIDPYAWDGSSGIIRFTPIEECMWSFIRHHGGIFYPQYPLLNCFVDFANPKAKVGIECDGAAYHDAKKDAKRDRLFEEQGWIIYRFKGSECVKDSTADAVKNLIDMHGIKRGAS